MGATGRLLPFTEGSLDDVFAEIARTVDRIEDHEFTPPSAADLARGAGRDGGREVAFATLHCRNCDGRFSCDSYREYMLAAGPRGRRMDLGRYLAAGADDGEIEEWLDGNIELDLEQVFPEEER